MLLEVKDKLVMIGDSITDCGRARPVGEGLFDAIGKGYAGLVDALLTAAYPERGIRVVNVGTSGNTVLDLKARWQTDVLDQKPDWLSIMIGTNDVWRQFDTPLIIESHVYPEEYAATLEELVIQTRPKLKGLVLMTPFYLEPNPNDAMRAQMDRYGAIVREIAAKHDALFVDTQAAFNRVMEHIYPATIAWDRVHPSQAGHAVLARAFLQAVGFDYSQGLS
ncbi:SGNH/GDSL hydrolase family protein [Paenibacillus sp. BC26]|uniref:SGNH/GDSL hydrolase family protein n=1 Tax=Paenibacillus sp. BC26 TaxID=1881032 RepID=UPI0008E5A6F8|nr:SGNH/GDSL hydrolase family protein [Paenibacillus sp. BC26]SFT01851.1 Lysophospholipase L1 [Paenibacillus sp. BC26]